MGSGSDHQFATTHWSMVHDAARRNQPEGRVALTQLCQAYWYPLYSYLRRRGVSPSDAEDTLQSFFVRFLEQDALGAADPARGKFRSFLAASLQNFLSNERRAERALKRGGGAAILSLDFSEADRRYQREPADTSQTPEEAFDRQWAWTLVQQALETLRDDWRRKGKEELYEALKPLLQPGAATPSYDELAQRLDMTPGSLRVAAHRFRQECGQAIRQEIRRTVASDDDVEDELRKLFALLSRQ
ncbi:MAG: sigma-70 family RNA polymerase sigma factor [Pirellulaceae bacterium]